jgi:hypothetical protein
MLGKLLQWSFIIFGPPHWVGQKLINDHCNL